MIRRPPRSTRTGTRLPHTTPSDLILLFLSFLREYTTAVFIYMPGTEVIGTTLLSLWVQGSSGIVAALATIQIILVAAVVVISRSEEHTSELQSLMRISYAVFCLKKTNINIKCS